MSPRGVMPIQQAFSSGEKCTLRNLVLREWRPFLTRDEHHVAVYIYDSSIEWGRHSLEATFDQLSEGIRASTQWVMPPIMMGRSLFYRTVDAMKAHGMLLVESFFRRFTRFTLNPEWSPAEGVPTMALAISKAKREQLGPEAAGDLFAQEMALVSRSGTTDPDLVSRSGTLTPKSAKIGGRLVSRSGTSSVPLRDPYKHTDKQEREESDLSQAASVAPVHPFIRKRAKPTTPFSSEASNEISCTRREIAPETTVAEPLPAFDPRPERTARQAVVAAEAATSERRTAFAEKAKPLDTFLAYEATWLRAWAETYEDNPAQTWSQQEGHMIRAVLKSRFRENVPARHDFLDFVTRNWQAIIADKFGWMRTSPPPPLPKLTFLASPKIVMHFLDAYAERKRYEVIALATGQEAELKRLLALGLTRDAAMIKIGERKAQSVIRTKDAEERKSNSGALAAANAAYAKAVEAQRKVMEDRATLKREQSGATVAKSGAVAAKVSEPFEELAGWKPDPLILPPVDLSFWN